MIDIHSHIIPYVDDGSPSFGESIEMIRKAYNDGCDTFICTPHYIYNYCTTSIGEIKDKFNTLVKLLEQEKIPVKLLLGQEICYSSRFDIVTMLNHGDLLTINNTNYILLEFMFDRPVDDFFEKIQYIIDNGFKIIIAHVERYKWFTFETVDKLKEMGCLIQINANGVLGLSGKSQKKFCKSLLENNLVDYVASDMHSFRPSNLKAALSKIKNKEKLNNEEIFFN